MVSLQEVEPAPGLTCQLRGYQKQALKWMLDLEHTGQRQHRGEGEGEEAAAGASWEGGRGRGAGGQGGGNGNVYALHPCWEEYVLPHK